MKRFRYEALVVIFWTLVSSRVAVSVVTLQCDSLQQLCDDDDQPRMCMCTVNTNILAWSTSITSGAVATFLTGTTVGFSESMGGFTGVLTGRANGMTVSTLTFNPSIVRPNGSVGVNVSCEGSSTNTTNIAVIPADVPGPRVFGPHTVSCGPDNTYQITLQWNDDDTDVTILRYEVNVTSSPPDFMCPQDQCNVTTNSTTITGLNCSTDYNFTVRAVNCNGFSDVSNTYNIRIPSPIITPPTLSEPPCYERDGSIRVMLNEYSSSCYSVTRVKFSYCANDDNFDGIFSTLMVLLPGTGSRDSCNVTVKVTTDCGDSDPVTMTTSGDCSMPSSTTMPTISPSSPMSTSDNPPPTNSTMDLTGPGLGGGVAGIVTLALSIAVTIFVCLFCPCRCCMPCRRMCYGCCPEEKICYRWGSDDEYSEPTPYEEKQPVQSYSTETKEKDVETGQPSYPSSVGPMYQDPSTIQRQAAPTTGDLYAQPEKPARHQKQKPPPAPVEMATYQDPSTIQRQAAPTGDLYAQPDKPPRPPAGHAPVYSEVKKSNQVADTVYSEVRESRN